MSDRTVGGDITVIHVPHGTRIFTEVTLPDLRRRRTTFIRKTRNTQEEIADAVSSSLSDADPTPVIEAMVKLARKKGWK